MSLLTLNSRALVRAGEPEKPNEVRRFRTGWQGRTRKPLRGYPHRGFESHPLRQSTPPNILRGSRTRSDARGSAPFPDKPPDSSEPLTATSFSLYASFLWTSDSH